MSSLTIEVDDPEDAYENLRAMLEAAPVEFSQVTSVRLELEYESDEAETTSGAERTDAAAGTAGTAPATDESDARTESGGVDFADPTAVASTENTQPAPPIADAENSEQSDVESPVDGADEITFRKPGEDDPDDEPSVFGESPDTGESDSVFTGPDDPVTFDEPDSNAGRDGSKTTENGRQLGDAVDRSTANAAGGGDQQRPVNPSPQTYNKVVRLLQNRDFPIERGEIEDVAVGAYDVDLEQCRAVIDAAIEKGLVAQEGSQLVDPTE